MMNNKILNNDIKFKCQNSSNCCISRGSYGYVYLSDKDLSKLSKLFKISKFLFKKKYCSYTNNFLHLKEINKNGNCIFLKEKKCSVYSARPIQCRTWPFWNENLNPKKWNNEIMKFCPGIGKGKKINIKRIIYQINLDIKNEKNIIKKN